MPRSPSEKLQNDLSDLSTRETTRESALSRDSNRRSHSTNISRDSENADAVSIARSMIRGIEFAESDDRTSHLADTDRHSGTSDADGPSEIDR